MARILLVDDDTVLTRLYKNAFEHAGYEVDCAIDGKEALEKVKQEKPSLILSDTMMPHLDGIEMCKKLKSKKATKDIPVVIMSNLANEEDVEAALAAGAVKHINKRDSGPKEVVAQINEVLSGV